MKKTESGFEYSLSDTVKDDFELVEVIQEFTEGNKLVAPTLIKRLLGPEQYDRLKEHCRRDGIVSTAQMLNEATEILNDKGDKELKN